MSVHVTYPHIETRNGEPARLRRIPRVRVAQIVMDYLTHGWSVEEMCRQHSYLTPAEAHAAMAYYFDHQQEIEEEIRAEWEEVKRESDDRNPSPFLARMRAKGLL